MEHVDFCTALWMRDYEEETIEDGVQGSAAFDSLEGITLQIPVGCLLDQDWVNGVKSYGVDPIVSRAVFGYCQNGDLITLSEVSTFGPEMSCPGLEKETLSARRAFVTRGEFVTPGVTVKSINLYISGLWYWACPSVGRIITQIDQDEGRWVSTSGTWTATDLEKKLLYEDESICLSIVPSLKMGGGHIPLQNFSMKADVSLLIEIKRDDVDIDSAMERWVYPSWRFLTLAMGFRGSVQRISVARREGPPFDYYLPLVSGFDNPSENQLDHMPLPYRAIEGRSQEILSSWFSMSGDAARGASIIADTIGERRIRRLVSWFATLAGAFEAMSRVDEKTSDLSPEQYSEAKRIAEKAYEESAYRDWVLRKLSNNFPSAGYYAERLIEKLGSFANYVVPDKKRFLRDLRNNRNAYVHQTSKLENKRILTGNDLYCHSMAIMLLCHGAVMLQLGLSPEEIVDCYQKSRYCWNEIFEARKMYEVQPSDKINGK